MDEIKGYQLKLENAQKILNSRLIKQINNKNTSNNDTFISKLLHSVKQQIKQIENQKTTAESQFETRENLIAKILQKRENKAIECIFNEFKTKYTQSVQEFQKTTKIYGVYVTQMHTMYEEIKSMPSKS